MMLRTAASLTVLLLVCMHRTWSCLQVSHGIWKIVRNSMRNSKRFFLSSQLSLLQHAVAVAGRVASFQERLTAVVAVMVVVMVVVVVVVGGGGGGGRRGSTRTSPSESCNRVG